MRFSGDGVNDGIGNGGVRDDTLQVEQCRSWNWSDKVFSLAPYMVSNLIPPCWFIVAGAVGSGSIRMRRTSPFRGTMGTITMGVDCALPSMGSLALRFVSPIYCPLQLLSTLCCSGFPFGSGISTEGCCPCGLGTMIFSESGFGITCCLGHSLGCGVTLGGETYCTISLNVPLLWQDT